MTSSSLRLVYWKMYKVYLTDTELKMLRLQNQERHSQNHFAKVNDKQICDRPSVDIGFEGICGEYAFCKRNNLFFSFDSTPRSGGPDAVFNDGSFDIKTVVMRMPESFGLRVPDYKIKTASDIFVLAEFKNNCIVFHGFLNKEQLFVERRKRLHVNGKTVGTSTHFYYAHYSELMPIERLDSMMQTK